ncbi:hypothetical protein BJ166DRAFT_506725 [Pestalotiopsis sp. NC0098]|nr:hypothetical protein BJ166DRAFT_506725 [Pestalotiopsis sp. NC0098]
MVVTCFFAVALSLASPAASGRTSRYVNGHYTRSAYLSFIACTARCHIFLDSGHLFLLLPFPRPFVARSDLVQQPPLDSMQYMQPRSDLHSREDQSDGNAQLRIRLTVVYDRREREKTPIPAAASLAS